MLLMLGAGMVMILAGGPLVKLLGAFAVISAMRNFTSSVGHHLTHSTTQLPWPGKWTRTGYNALSALFLLSSFEEYRKAHGVHHGKVAGGEDPDQRFIEYVQARLTGWLPFLGTLLDPRFHARFLKARLKASIGSGPAWRRAFALAGVLAVFGLPVAAAATWFATLIVGYQAVSMLSWLSLHLWGARPASGRPAEMATAVTFGRLLLPEASYRGLALLPVYALVRLLWLQGDLVNHDLHHLWQGPWTEAPYVRTRLLLEGFPLRQTINVRNMFRVAFDAAANTRARRAEMSESGMRTM
jgi:fatty acid desaturase